MKTVINIKADKELKESAQKLAREIGLPLSTIVNAYLKEFVEKREVTFSADRWMSPRLEKIVAQARRDYKAGRNISPILSTPEEIDHYLQSL